MLRATNSELKTVNNKGFTLIEIIVLIVMAGILLPAIVVPFVTGVRGSGKPELVTTAMYLAHQRMEELMKYEYNRAELNPIALTGLAAAPISGYRWQWRIEWVVPATVGTLFNNFATDQGYKRILVRVTDPEGDPYDVYSVVTHFP